MSKIGLFISVVWFAISASYAQTKEYKIDTELSTIKFSVSHMGFLTVHGEFGYCTGTLSFDDHKNLKDIKSDIRVNSLTTGDKKRDQILLSDAYLNESKYPYITFKAIKITASVISGVLQIRNVKKNIEMPYTFQTNRTGIKAETQLKRSDFNIDFGAMNALVGDKILVILDIHIK